MQLHVFTLTGQAPREPTVMQCNFNVKDSNIKILFDTGAIIFVIFLSMVVRLGLQRTLMDEMRFIRTAGKNNIFTNKMVKIH